MTSERGLRIWEEAEVHTAEEDTSAADLSEAEAAALAAEEVSVAEAEVRPDRRQVDPDLADPGSVAPDSEVRRRAVLTDGDGAVRYSEAAGDGDVPAEAVSAAEDA